MIRNIHTKNISSFLKKWWCSILLLPFIGYSLHQIYWALSYNIFFAVTYEYPLPYNIIYILVDNFLLITHEAGHTFFSIFGIRFLTILGGSLLQLILPLLIVIFFQVNSKRIGLQLSLCLLGFSWIDVAGYAADAGARQLPLIGGLSKESHDWFNLLHQLNWLDYDIHLAILFTSIGLVCYILALGMPLATHYRQMTIDLKL